MAGSGRTNAGNKPGGNDERVNGNGKAFLQPLLMLLLIMGGLSAIITREMNHLESQARLESEYRDTVTDLERDYQNQLGVERQSMLSQRINRNENAITQLRESTRVVQESANAKIAALQQKFGEVETQFRWKEELSKAADLAIGERLEVVENVLTARSEQWVPELAALQERIKSLESQVRSQP